MNQDFTGATMTRNGTPVRNVTIRPRGTTYFGELGIHGRWVKLTWDKHGHCHKFPHYDLIKPVKSAL